MVLVLVEVVSVLVWNIVVLLLIMMVSVWFCFIVVFGVISMCLMWLVMVDVIEVCVLIDGLIWLDRCVELLLL